MLKTQCPPLFFQTVGRGSWNRRTTPRKKSAVEKMAEMENPPLYNDTKYDDAYLDGRD